jgi:phage baseplate assembly protein V
VTLDELSRFIEPLKRRVMLSIGRATLSRVDDGAGLQRNQVTLLAGETRDNVERVQPFGFTSVPLPGAECLVVCVGGNRDHPVIMGVDDRRYRPTGLDAGDVCIYSPQSGHRITLKADRTIEIEGDILVLKADTKIRLEAPLVEMTGGIATAAPATALNVTTPALNVTGEVQDRSASGGMTMKGMRDDYNAHNHGGPGPTPPMAP